MIKFINKKVLIILLTVVIIVISYFIKKNGSEKENEIIEVNEAEEREGFNKIVKNIYKEEEFVDIYLIPHSHCDGGWLESFDEYYQTRVISILDTVTEELELDETKKFSWSEIAYFEKWWSEQNDIKKDKVRKIIENGQFEFVTGGWVQNDEAGSNLDDIIEQMTQGQIWLREEFNYTIEYGWQIDSFGYSTITPILFSKMNIRGLVINRVPIDIRQYMRDNKEMEFIWRGSTSLVDSEMLVTVYDKHYSYPVKAIDPLRNEGFKLWEKVSDFVEYVHQLKVSRNSKILIIPIGDDFKYIDAKAEFAGSKEWISYIQERKSEFGIANIRYSTLSEYFKRLKHDLVEKNTKIKKFDQDFFPYNTDPDEYWTGYFTTRPVLKKAIRELSDNIRITDSLYGLLSLENKYKSNEKLYRDLQNNRNILSATQHHDIVTGTSKSYVLYDFFVHIKTTRFSNLNMITNLYKLLLDNNKPSQQQQQLLSSSTSNNNNNDDPLSNNYLYNNFINLNELNQNQFYSIKLFNSLGWDFKQHYSFKLKSNSVEKLQRLKLYDSNFKEIQIQINRLDYGSNRCFGRNELYVMYSIIELPALGFSTYYIGFDGSNSNGNLNEIDHQKIKSFANDFEIKTTNGSIYKYKFSKKTGLLKSIQMNEFQDEISVEQSFQDYNPKHGGAYLFEDSELTDSLHRPDYFVYADGPLVSQLSVIYNSRDCKNFDIINQRIYKNPNSAKEEQLITQTVLETSYSIVGKYDKEKVIHLKVDSMKNSLEFATDNGLETRKRTYHEGKTTSNYYPILHYSSVKDNENKYTMHVDRSVGTTLKPEQNKLEIMIHRTLNRNDGKGIGWPQRDISRIDGKLFLNIQKISKDNEKLLSLKLNHQPFYLTKRIDAKDIKEYQNQFKQSFSGLLKPLPSHIHLLSMKTQRNGNLGLRLLNLGSDSDSNTLDLNKYFKYLDQFNMVETGLTFLELKDTLQDSNDSVIFSKWDSDPNFLLKAGPSEFNYNLNDKKNLYNLYPFNSGDSKTIQINPLEIKSYMVDTQQNIDDKIEFSYDNTIYDHIMYKNNTNSPKYVDNIYNVHYQYEFSVYDVELNYYQDVGDIDDYELNIILVSTITPSVIAIIGLIIWLVKRRRNNNLNKKK